MNYMKNNIFSYLIITEAVRFFRYLPIIIESIFNLSLYRPLVPDLPFCKDKRSVAVRGSTFGRSYRSRASCPREAGCHTATRRSACPLLRRTPTEKKLSNLKITKFEVPSNGEQNKGKKLQFVRKRIH